MTKTLIKKQLMEVFAWLYMALMGIVSVTLGVFGSVFNTFSTLYQVRDNDLLFAMPITERSVLTARLSGVYAMGLMYELFVLGSDMFSGLPTIIPSFIVLTIPMSHLRRKLCQQGLPQFLCLISIAQTWNPYPFVFCPRPGFSSFGAGMRLASFQERS